MKLIVGLGNPGREYIATRHNVGFIVLENFANAHNCTWEENDKFSGIMSTWGDYILLKPTTFMNNSGVAVSKVVNFFKISLENIYVVHDDLDLSLGVVKKQFDRGSAGHHGIESITQHLGSAAYNRVRVGIGRPSSDSKIDASSYVLQNFSKDEFETVCHINLETFLN